MTQSPQNFVLKLKRQVDFELAFKINQITISMLFQPIVRESVLFFYVFLFRCIPDENYIFADMSAVSSLFSLLTKGS